MRRPGFGRWAIVATSLLTLTACSDPKGGGEGGQPIVGDEGTSAGDGAAAPDGGEAPDAGEAPDQGTGPDTGPGADAPRPGPDVVEPSSACAEHVDLLTLIDREAVELVNGESAGVQVEVPEGAVSMTITVEGDDDGMYALGYWEAPGANLVYDGWFNQSQGGPCQNCDVRIASSEGAFAALTPNNPASSVPPGTHEFSAFGFRFEGGFGGFGGQPVAINGTVYVSVHVKMLPSLPETGVLDLNLHFTGANGWWAADAPNNAEVQELIGKVDEIYQQVGVTIGRVTYRDIDESYRVIETVTGPGSDLMEMFALSEGNEMNALNLFLVEELSSPFGVILGVAGGIPGPPVVQGTLRSGVAVVVSEVPGVPADVETTMAHEMGHFLGLYHTIEQNFGFGPQLYDPLPDTPESDDTSWLMHNQGSGSKLSDWQGVVIRSNPWVCHPEEN